jgi:hypothetical protein
MMKRLYVGFMLLLTMAASSVHFAQPAYACTDSLLGIPAWYRGIQDKSTCTIKMPETKDKNGVMKPDIQRIIMTIALNVIQAGLALVAYVTVFFIIKGGFGYMTSAGSSDGMSSAKKTITNAVIGLVIAVFAASIVNAVAGIIK